LPHALAAAERWRSSPTGGTHHPRPAVQICPIWGSPGHVIVPIVVLCERTGKLTPIG